MQYDSTKVDIANISMDDLPNFIPNLSIRYTLNIPFLNVNEGMTVMVIMMNPSKANCQVSDPSLDKLIEYFWNKKVNEKKIRKIKVCNVFPVYAGRPKKAFNRVQQYYFAGTLDKLHQINQEKMKNEFMLTDIVVLAWGKPTEGSFPYLYYYQEVNKIIELTFKEGIDTYVFEVDNISNILTKSNDPRHPAGTYGKKIKKIVDITKSELLGFY